LGSRKSPKGKVKGGDPQEELNQRKGGPGLVLAIRKGGKTRKKGVTQRNREKEGSSEKNKKQKENNIRWLWGGQGARGMIKRASGPVQGRKVNIAT